MNVYWNIFIEAAWGASVIPMASEATLAAINSFGGYNMPLAVALAVVGATLGQAFNWYCGFFLLKLRRKGILAVSDYWYDKVSYIFNRYIVFLLVFSWVPLCKLFLMIAGFLDARLKFVLPLVFIGQLFNYGRYLF